MDVTVDFAAFVCGDSACAFVYLLWSICFGNPETVFTIEFVAAMVNFKID